MIDLPCQFIDFSLDDVRTSEGKTCCVQFPCSAICMRHHDLTTIRDLIVQFKSKTEACTFERLRKIEGDIYMRHYEWRIVVVT